VFGGGFPITMGGSVVGIVVSGGHYTQDMEVAQAGTHTRFCNGCTTDTRPGGTVAPTGCGGGPGVPANSHPRSA